jgi:predicted secreted protein
MSLPYHLGHNVRISIGGTAIAHARDCKLSLTKETKKINHKDIDPGAESGGFTASVGGLKTATGTCTAYLYKTGSSLASLKTAWKDDTELDFVFGGGSGTFTDSFKAIITNIEETATDGEVCEYSVTFESVGVITFA